MNFHGGEFDGRPSDLVAWSNRPPRRNMKQESDDDEIRDQRASAVRNKRHGNPGQRYQLEHSGHDDDGLEREHRCEPNG